jgi:CAP-Gly domain-containing linker protein 3/4
VAKDAEAAEAANEAAEAQAERRRSVAQQAAAMAEQEAREAEAAAEEARTKATEAAAAVVAERVRQRGVFGPNGIAVGARVEVGGEEDRGAGTVRFVGQTDFEDRHGRVSAAGWVGIEMDERRATGKMAGTIHGHTYFECAPGHGVFAPPYRIWPAGHAAHYAAVRQHTPHDRSAPSTKAQPAGRRPAAAPTASTSTSRAGKGKAARVSKRKRAAQ